MIIAFVTVFSIQFSVEQRQLEIRAPPPPGCIRGAAAGVRTLVRSNVQSLHGSRRFLRRASFGWSAAAKSPRSGHSGGTKVRPCLQTWPPASAGVPEKGDDQSTRKRAGGPKPDGKAPAHLLRQLPGTLVAGAAPQVAHRIDKPGRCRRRPAPRQVHRERADQQHLRAEYAKADQEKDRYRWSESPPDHRVIADRQQTEQRQQQANHRRAPSTEKPNRRPPAEKR